MTDNVILNYMDIFLKKAYLFCLVFNTSLCVILNLETPQRFLGYAGGILLIFGAFFLPLIQWKLILIDSIKRITFLRRFLLVAVLNLSFTFFPRFIWLIFWDIKPNKDLSMMLAITIATSCIVGLIGSFFKQKKTHLK